MWKNYMLAALNVAVAGLPFLVGWDLVLYGVYCGFAVLLLGLTAWNPVGDWLSILFVFYADFGEILYRIKWYNAIRFVGNSSDIVNVTVTRKISKD